MPHRIRLIRFLRLPERGNAEILFKIDPCAAAVKRFGEVVIHKLIQSFVFSVPFCEVQRIGIVRDFFTENKSCWLVVDIINCTGEQKAFNI